MKLRKGILYGLLILLITIVLGLNTEVKADTEEYYLGIPDYRSSGYKYKAHGNIIWKIASYSASAEGKNLANEDEREGLIANFDDTFYCIKAGPGFGSQDMNNGTTTSSRIIRKYNQKFDFKNVSSIPEPYNSSSIIPTGDNYKAVVWILENCWIPEEETITDFKARLYNKGVSIGKLTEDDIDAIQQLAIWYYTNKDSVYDSETVELSLRTQSSGFTALSDMGDDGWDRAEQADDLYDYLINGWVNNNRPEPSKNKKNNSTNYILSISTTSSSKVELVGDDYYLGPYNISTNLKDYTLETSLKNGNTSITNYSILNSNKVAVNGIKDTITNSTSETATNDGQFYIKVNKNLYADSLTFSVTIKGDETSIEYWSVTPQAATVESLALDQPLVKVDKTPYNETKTLTITGEKYFDLALRKYIVGLKDSNGNTKTIANSRSLNNIDKSLIATEKTAGYKHRKDPVVAEAGDYVTYRIATFNEGDITGYVYSIKDYLPQYLEFVPTSDFVEEGETSSTAHYKYSFNETTRLLTITKNIIDQEDNSYLWSLNPYNGSDLDSKYIELTFKIDENFDPEADTYLTNVATMNYSSVAGSGQEIDDRDSSPSTFTVQSQSTLVSTNMLAYKGNEENNNDLTKEAHFKGQEDDDDFEKIVIKAKTEMDLALRKFITKVLPQGATPGTEIDYKEPRVDTSKLNTIGEDGKLITTAEYIHPKDPVGVAVGDEVIYNIRVYNEGNIDGYVTEITDHLPPQLEFIVNDELNVKNGWKLDPTDTTNKTIVTKVTSPYNEELSATRDQLFEDRTEEEDKVLLKAFDGGNTLDYIEVQIKCRVKETQNKDLYITNIADITGFTDSNGRIVSDRDSNAKNVVLPTTEQAWSDYKGTSNNSILNTPNYFYKGQEDDDDFDKLMLKEFDLALRKFITKINDDAPEVSREPVVDLTNLKNSRAKTATYTHPKDPLYVQSSDIVEYTIRVYNEGDIDGYASLIKDDIPEGLEFIPNNETNELYGWQMLDEDGNVTTNVKEAVSIVTDALSMENETDDSSNLLRAFDPQTMNKLSYKDVKVAFKVIAPNTYTEIITNKAQISDDSDENGKDIIDRDSTPDKWIEGEDDQDVEHIKLRYFDLALRKFITGVNDTKVTNRYPVFKITEDGKYVYEHTKEPVDVMNGDIVTYTIRVYNEGTIAGYAEKVKDDIPEGLEFLPDNEINKNIGWVMLDKDGNETEDVTKAVSVVTDYLSMEKAHGYGLVVPGTTNTRINSNLLSAFNPETMEEPDHLDLQIAFKVTEPNTSDRILINHAQISDDADENGKDVIDIDSNPDKWIEGEDDQDIEKVKVKYFDLALRKWVTQAIVIENGVEKVTETGHKAEDDPEEVVKVEIEKSKLNKVVVKFNYSIRITSEGEIAGYAKEISDYIPEGLQFVAADNPEWREVDGKVVTNKLADTLLQPGESAEVEILLTWINDADNMGLKINVAEISEDYNDSHTPDIDSTPNNKVPGEDDIDDAPVILATKTGGITSNPYIMLTIGSLTIISTGAILIKKYILK